MRPKTNVSHGSRANMAYWIVEALHYCMTPLFFDLVCNSVEWPLLSTPPLPLPAVSALCFYVLEFVSLPLRNRLRTNSKLFGKIQTHTHIHTTEVWKKNNYNKREIKWEEIFVFAAVTQQHKHTRDIQQTTQIQQNPNQKSSHFNNSPTPNTAIYGALLFVRSRIFVYFCTNTRLTYNVVTDRRHRLSISISLGDTETNGC